MTKKHLSRSDAEALIARLRYQGGADNPWYRSGVADVMDAAADALELSLSPTLTEDDVENAAKAGHEYLRDRRPPDRGPYDSWEELHPDFREYLRGIARASLDAGFRVTPEPVYEYGVIAEGDDEPYSDIGDDPDWILESVGSGGASSDCLNRRVKAGPWLPVVSTSKEQNENE